MFILKLFKFIQYTRNCSRKSHSASLAVNSPLLRSSNHAISCLIMARKNSFRSLCVCLSQADAQHAACNDILHLVMSSLINTNLVSFNCANADHDIFNYQFTQILLIKETQTVLQPLLNGICIWSIAYLFFNQQIKLIHTLNDMYNVYYMHVKQTKTNRGVLQI